MTITYIVENYINENTLHSVSSGGANAFYGMERLYNERPSWPLRFTGVGSTGPDVSEWICVDMGAAKRVTFAGIFGHNLTARTALTPERFSLKGCDFGCEPGSGGCNWDNLDPAEIGYAWEEDMLGRILSDKICDDEYEFIFANSCKNINRNQQYYRFEFIDTGNPDGYIEIGEAVLGKRCQFASTVYLQPGRPDGPIFYMGNQQTPYGQDHPNYFSYAERFVLTFKNINDTRTQDELQLFLLRVQRNGGRFIIVPDDEDGSYPGGYIPRCYYVIIENQRDYATRLVHGWSKELREWSIELKTLTTGLKLIG